VKITLISNFLNHHQQPLCDTFLSIPGVEFTFIATEQIPEERIQMGYGCHFDHLPYYYEAIEESAIVHAEKICFDSDVLIYGSAPMSFIQRRLRAKKLTFHYSERWFKQGFWRHPGDVIRAIRNNTQFNNPNFYLLCASAYTAYDSNRVFAFPGRKFYWGYFPQVKKHNIEMLIEGKKQNSLLWVGRFLDWKHPEKAIEVARRLKDENISFQLSMIGTGEMEDEIRALVGKYGLERQVKLLGSMTPDEVRGYMEQAQIFLFTSDYNEGWGAVLNEAMNSGCAVVASHAIGSAPYLIDHEKNGFIYQNDDMEQLYQQVRQLLLQDDLAKTAGENAYQTMISCWNAETAAHRLYEFCTAKLGGRSLPKYSDGPISNDDGKAKKHG